MMRFICNGGSQPPRTASTTKRNSLLGISPMSLPDREDLRVIGGGLLRENDGGGGAAGDDRGAAHHRGPEPPRLQKTVIGSRGGLDLEIGSERSRASGDGRDGRIGHHVGR